MRTLLLIVALSSCTTPNEPPEIAKARHPHAEVLELLEGEAREAFVLLAGTEVFAEESVGYGGGLSREVEALRLLVRHPDAQAAIGALWQGSKPVGRLYALAGFWYLRPGDYREALESLRNDDTEIQTLSGCLGGFSTVGTIIGTPHDAALVPGSDLFDAACYERPMARTMEVGTLPIAFVEGSVYGSDLCDPPRGEWARLTLATAWPDPETEGLRERQRANAIPREIFQLDDDAMEMLIQSARESGAVVR